MSSFPSAGNSIFPQTVKTSHEANFSKVFLLPKFIKLVQEVTCPQTRYLYQCPLQIPPPPHTYTHLNYLPMQVIIFILAIFQTSPVVNEGHSALLEMWINKADEKNVREDEFTSPPFRQTRHQKIKTPTSTPLIQRLVENKKSLYNCATKTRP